MEDKLDSIGKMLWKDQSKSNWSRFTAALKNSGSTYYRVTFERGKLNNRQDLRSSHAEIFNAKGKLLTKIPIFRREGKKIIGATINLKGLLNINKPD